MPPNAGSGSIFQSLLFPYIIIMLIFYFLVMKPQKDKQKQHKAMIDNLKKNDEIITTGGIHATVVNVKEATVIVRIDDNVKMEINKDAIATIKINNK